jgi:trk system potassium uptake protein TrkA
MPKEKAFIPTKDKQGSGSFGVIGLGRFGFTLAKKLAESGRDVVVLDSSEQKIREARAFTDAAFVADTLDRETLTEAGIQNCDTVIVAIGEKIDTSILTTLTVKQLGVKRVIAKAMSQDQGSVLETLGAEVIYPESDMAARLAKRLTTTNVLDYLSISSDVEISELRLTDRVVGQTIVEAGFRQKYGINIIALVNHEGITTNIRPDYRLRADDVIVVIGKNDGIQRFEAFQSKER